MKVKETIVLIISLSIIVFMVVLLRFPWISSKGIWLVEHNVEWNQTIKITSVDKNIWSKYNYYPKNVYLYREQSDMTGQTRIFWGVELFSGLNNYKRKKTLYHELYHYSLIMMAKDKLKSIKDFYLLSYNIKEYIKNNNKIFKKNEDPEKVTEELNKEIKNLENTENYSWKSDDTKRLKVYLNLLLFRIMSGGYNDEIFKRSGLDKVSSKLLNLIVPLKVSTNNNLVNEMLAYQGNVYYFWKLLKNEHFWLSLIFYNLQDEISVEKDIKCKNIEDIRLNNICNEINTLNKTVYKKWRVN